MANTRIYAHSLEGLPTERWQTLETHLAAVAERAAAFARPCFDQESMVYY